MQTVTWGPSINYMVGREERTTESTMKNEHTDYTTVLPQSGSYQYVGSSHTHYLV